MKAVFFSLLLVLFCGQSQVTAQTAAPTKYTTYSYMKVAPGMRDEYVALEKAWKKIHLAQKKAGKLDGWSIAEVIMPYGSANAYDFVCRDSYVGEDQLAGSFSDGYMPENWQSLLTIDEIGLVMRTGEIRTVVKTEVWQVETESWSEDTGKGFIAVFNYFKGKPGKTNDDHIKMENKIWKPVHEMRIKDGKMKGWLTLSLSMPYGTAMPYDMATIDVYTDMKQYLTPWTDSYLKKAHPGKDVAALFKETNETTDLLRSEVRQVVDRLDW